MNRRIPIEMLEAAAADLAPLCEDIVFVGGAVVCLLITDPGAPPVSSTKDIDVVVSVTTNYEYSEGFGGRLRQLGFGEDSSEGAPLCRWCRKDGVTLDVMPTDPKILGFSNQWFPLAFETATRHLLPSGREIRVVTARLNPPRCPCETICRSRCGDTLSKRPSLRRSRGIFREKIESRC